MFNSVTPVAPGGCPGEKMGRGLQAEGPGGRTPWIGGEAGWHAAGEFRTERSRAGPCGTRQVTVRTWHVICGVKGGPW